MTDRLFTELYGHAEQPGIRTEIALLKDGIDKLHTSVEEISHKQTPRWVMIFFLIVFAICAIVTAGVTLVSAIRAA